MLCLHYGFYAEFFCNLKDNEKYYAKAEAVVNLASDVNTKIFEEIVLGGGIMSDALKEMLLPELGELKRQLAESNMELAENRAELARKDAIIAELRRVLAESGQDMDEFVQ